MFKNLQLKKFIFGTQLSFSLWTLEKTSNTSLLFNSSSVYYGYVMITSKPALNPFKGLSVNHEHR